MNLREYKPSDFGRVSELFCETINSVNIADYTKEQCEAWTAKSNCLDTRRSALIDQRTIVAEENGVIIGFGSIDNSGCLDLLFVDKGFQGKGVATALCDELEKDFERITTYSSVTAKPFFENRDYIVVKAQEVDCLGVSLPNFQMQKKLYKE